MADSSRVTPSDLSEMTPQNASPQAVAEKPVTEMKVVIILNSNKLMIGVQSPDCDPVYQTMEGDLDVALQQLPSLITQAKQQWATSPRYPRSPIPEPSAPASTATPVASSPAVAKSSSSLPQPKFF